MRPYSQSRVPCFRRYGHGADSPLHLPCLRRRGEPGSQYVPRPWCAGGDRVAVQLGNSPEFIECLLALAKIGAVLVPLSECYTPNECRYIVEACNVRLLVTQAERWEQSAVSPQVDVVVVDASCGADSLQVVPDVAGSRPAVASRPDGPGLSAGGDAPSTGTSAPSCDDAGPSAATADLSAASAGPAAGPAEESDESQTRHGARPVGRYGVLKLGESTRLRERRPLADQDLLEIMYTSGTTDRPKGVMLTHANFIFSGTYVCWELGMGPDDRYLSTMAATHVNLQLSALMPVIAAGATLILQRRYSARRFWRQARKHHATLVQGMAMIIRTLLLQPVDPQEREHWVRDVHYFLPLTDTEKQRFEERFGVHLLNNYGSTESLVGVITDLSSWPRRWPSIGRAGIGYQVRILTADGSEALPGERGEIVIRGTPGRSLMAGYWNDPEATARVIDSEGWYHTGDIGTRDADGWFYFVDRKADLIKRSGENISAAEVEGVLRGCPGVADVAVVGVPDEVRDEAVKAVIVPGGSDLSEEDVAVYARQHLACFKVPTIIEFRDELPRGEYGKVLKDLL
ncbi:hypothetical protein DDD63_04075 [Actinobaculum sp. 313]|nr:hypothetical protein DDD63_04075 [Actinobaculum sp. 313]